MKYINFLPIVSFLLVCFIFFTPVFFQNKIPIPADTIIGLYHPYRDLYKATYPNGIPYKNALITDPVRQQIPWRYAAFTSDTFPFWNPYTMAGMPLFANVQNGFLYPLNIIFFITHFIDGWIFLIFSQLMLAGFFTYLYLRSLHIHTWAASLGAIAFAFSGFSISWLTWGTILHTGLWLPLILLSIDKVFYFNKGSTQADFTKTNQWNIIFVFALTASFFAGHTQTFFYVFLVAFFYICIHIISNLKLITRFLVSLILFFFITAIQWIPTLQLITLSARSVDINWQQEGWFIPFSQLIQFLTPDFFGNPATLNYWGVWNYGEMIGYVGIIPLFFAVYALLYRREKHVYFFAGVLFASLVFATPTFFAKLPFQFSIPFISTAQPTRLLFLIDMMLAFLSGFGLDAFIKRKSKVTLPLILFSILLLFLWSSVLFPYTNVSVPNLLVAKRNLYLPTAIFIAAVLIIVLFKKTPKKLSTVIIFLFVAISAFDSLRFANKFTPFTEKKYFYPQTKIIDFLQKNLQNQRYMTTDSRILPPNFSVMYKMQTVDGYDPLYVRTYGEYIAASERNEANILPPFGFNRIITPHRYESRLMDLLGVRYVLSLSEFSLPGYKKVFEEGETKVYENTKAMPRVFFVKMTMYKSTSHEAMQALFAMESFYDTAVVNDRKYEKQEWTVGKVSVIEYKENKVVLRTVLPPNAEGFLVLTDMYYPMWHATIDGNKKVDITKVNYMFRGVVVPSGEHIITFYTGFPI